MARVFLGGFFFFAVTFFAVLFLAWSDADTVVTSAAGAVVTTPKIAAIAAATATIHLRLRIAIPPLNSQYLNLTKNSSLASAIAYPDLVNIARTIINQAGGAFQVLILVMAAYLVLSLTISVLMNLLNRAVAYRGVSR